MGHRHYTNPNRMNRVPRALKYVPSKWRYTKLSGDLEQALAGDSFDEELDVWMTIIFTTSFAFSLGWGLYLTWNILWLVYF